jgi:protein SCO1/2/putative membrane protein
MIDYTNFPAINASLNGASAVLIVTGRGLIKRGRVAAHRACMIAAVAASSLFLAGYLYYHARAGVIHFQGQGMVRPVYFAILTTHTILAAVIVPLVIVTLVRAWRGTFDRHRAIARWTFPVWLYVSITGVVIYLMLFRFYAAAPQLTSLPLR